MLSKASIRLKRLRLLHDDVADCGSRKSSEKTTASAPSDLTSAAVLSKLFLFRAARTTTEKYRASRRAVARPIPWLAPVTMAADFVVTASPLQHDIRMRK